MTAESQASPDPAACPGAAAARRLRMVQISFADEPEAQRRRYVADELATLLRTVPFEQRAAFLDDIEAAFPVFDAAPAAQAAAVTTPTPARAKDTVRDLVDQLAERAAGMSEAEREDLRRQLSEARLLPPVPETATGSSPEAMPESIRYVASVMKVERVDHARMARMMVMLAVHMGQIDDVVWSAWQAIAPDSDLRRSASLEETLRRYIAADRSISGRDLNAQIETTRRLLAAMVAGIGQLGIQLARQHLAPLAPQEIQLAAARKGGLLANQDAICWARYQQLARQIEEGAVDHAVKKFLAQYAEDIMKRQAAGAAPAVARGRTQRGDYA